ncbi:hypothetical protein B0T19DRAFT_190955 [Cercophora scortea]|uniref:Uncharacterized protein n=1 Tax=Cercophora scortea TaxID=314031 RepID=A0AAE0ING1_9PEZI|nr:hypothetical protein B0T19DRAFT_190955 [Cercophora scortea]
MPGPFYTCRKSLRPSPAPPGNNRPTVHTTRPTHAPVCKHFNKNAWVIGNYGAAPPDSISTNKPTTLNGAINTLCFTPFPSTRRYLLIHPMNASKPVDPFFFAIGCLLLVFIIPLFLFFSATNFCIALPSCQDRGLSSMGQACNSRQILPSFRGRQQHSAERHTSLPSGPPFPVTL